MSTDHHKVDEAIARAHGRDGPRQRRLMLATLQVARVTGEFTGRCGRERRGSSRCMGLCVGYPLRGRHRPVVLLFVGCVRALCRRGDRVA